MWNQNYDTNELIYETDSQAQRTDLWLPRRRGVGGMNWELGIQFSSVAQSCPTLYDSMDYSMPGFPVHHQHPQLTQTHVHWVDDTIQPSYPLLPPSPPAFNLSQYPGLF